MYSNFITPPDSLNEAERHSVLIIDADWPEIESVAMFCKTSKQFYNIHVYRAEMDDEVWLVNQAEHAKVLIINTTETTVSKIKDRLAEQSNAFYYGPKSFLNNSKRLSAPIDFFTSFDEKESSFNESQT